MEKTAKAKIEKYVLENPKATARQVADALDSTALYVTSVKYLMRKAGRLGKSIINRRKAPVEKRRTDHPVLATEADKVGFAIEDVVMTWVKTDTMSTLIKPSPISMKDVLEDITAEMKKYSPKYPVIKYPKIKEGHLLVIDPADIHIGKLCSAFETGDEYNHKIAIDRVKSGVEGIIHKAQGFPIDQQLLVIGNDMLHTDGAKSMTTAGTHQDTELMWYDAFKVAQKLLIECIEMLLSVAPVKIHYDPSNHDYVSGFMLAQTIEAWFRKSKGIEFNVSPAHRKYYRYHKNLIATTHGDGAKEKDLGYLMAHESEHWKECPHRYVYKHHLHHFTGKDLMSVSVETMRSVSGTDSWHHRNAYQHSPKAVQGFLHHKQHGQIAKLNHLF